MNDSWDFSGPALPGAYFSSATSSFTDFLRAQAPELLPGRRVPANAANLGVPHGTTIVALTYAGGVLIAGDLEAEDGKHAGRIVSYDAAGGRYEEHGGYAGIGSGSLFAKSAFKKLHDPDADRDAAVRVAVEALYDAADDDTASGGPDMVRRIFPTVVTVTAEHGAVQLPTSEAAAVAEAVVAGRIERHQRRVS